MTPSTAAAPLPADARILVLGFGNPSRGDDGAGPALASRLEALQLPGVTIETDYQLSIEHAALAAEHDLVVFADAAVDVGEADGLFYFRPVAPTAGDASLSHAASPGQVMFLAGSCFGASPAAYLLGMRATALGGFHDGLSNEARLAVDGALCFLLALVGRARLRPESETRDARR